MDVKAGRSKRDGRIFISGHNGHVKKSGNYDANNKVMGNLLADEIGNEYFVIGTDLFQEAIVYGHLQQNFMMR